MDRHSQTPQDPVISDRPSHRRSPSGGLLSKLSFLRASAEENQIPADKEPEGSQDQDAPLSPRKPGRAMAVAVQQRTRRRKGSLRKAALLGRGAQREKREMETSPLNTTGLYTSPSPMSSSPTSPEDGFSLDTSGSELPAYQVSGNWNDSMAGNASSTSNDASSSSNGHSALVPTPTIYASTTDEDDGLTIPPKYPARNDTAASSSDGYFSPFLHTQGLLTRRRSQNSATSSKAPIANSPLALGLAPSSTPISDFNWDYSETEWWGWVVLVVTWVVFVTGMGSCLGVWSWAWDVGETPYAPPELEDDPTLPIVGYYPALIILTGVMAWVWVVVAWVGMKYFRHARISGD